MPLKVLPSITNRSGSVSSRAPRWMLDSRPRRRPEPHSTASTTRSRVCTGLTFTQAEPRRPAAYGAVAVFDHDALVTVGEHLLRERARGLGIGASPARHPVLARAPVPSSAAQRSVAGRSSRSRPSRCSTSKKYGVTAVIPSADEAVREAVSWNGRGRPASSSAIASPSITSSVAGSARTTSTTSGSRWVMSSRLRVAISDLVTPAVDLDPDAVELRVHRELAIDLGQRRVEVGSRRRQHRLDRATDGESDLGQRGRALEGSVDDVGRATGQHRGASYVGDGHCRGGGDAFGHGGLERALSDVSQRDGAQPLLLGRRRPPEQLGDRGGAGGDGARPAQGAEVLERARRPRRRRGTPRPPAGAAPAGRASRVRCDVAGGGR